MQTITFAADGSQKLTFLHKAREHTQYVSLILAYGTFGGGTLTFFLSPDNGTTKVPLTSTMGGTGISCTSNAMAVITLGTPNVNFNTQQLQIWVTLAGSTSPSITVNNYDNNN